MERPFNVQHEETLWHFLLRVVVVGGLRAAVLQLRVQRVRTCVTL